MSKDLNLCQFIGRLGNDPDIRMTQSGTTTASFNLACSDDYKDQSGQKVEQTNWIRCVAFGRLAEIIKDYTKKGSKLYVSGKQSTRKWQNQAGVDQYTTEITINEMQMLDGKQDSQSSNGQANYQQPQQAQQRPQANQQRQAPQNQYSNQPNPRQHQQPQDDFDDSDIPFN